MTRRAFAHAWIASAAAAAAAAAAAFTFGAAEARPFTARDMVTLDRVMDPRVSPDGRRAVYQLRTVDYDANRASQSLWTVDLQDPTPTPRRLAISEGGANTPRWSPDGRYIYFLSSRSGSAQVWRTEPDGRNARQITNLPIDVGSFRVSPDGSRLLVSMAVFPECASLECSKQRLDARGADKRTGQIYDRLFVRHWDEWANGTRNQLFIVPTTGPRPATTAAPIMQGFDADTPSRPFGDENDYTFTPDGRAVVFNARVAGQTEAWSTNFDLFRVSLDNPGRPENLTADNPAWDHQPTFSPDGRYMAYRAMRRAGFEADRWRILVRDMTTGQTREIAANWDRSADILEWSDDGRTLYATAQDVGQTRIFAIDVASGRVTPLTGEGHVNSFDASDGAIVYMHDDLDSPAQLYLLRQGPGAEPRRLTDHNAERLAELEFGRYEQFRFRGWNGETVHGYLVRPVNYQEGRRYPVAFLIHGGPQGSFGNLFHYRWNAQTYAARGYAVVMIDFHGSTGYGQRFTDSISGHWGDRPLEDLQKGWRHALRTYPFLDGNRACALGGSYGGYMVNWIAGRWSEPWRCLVSHAGPFDLRSMAYSTEELWFTEWENQGLPWERPENVERFNPVRYVGEWDTPMLVTAGAQDFRIPLEQPLATFTALQRRGIPSRLLVFPDENHWVLKPQNSVQWHETVEAWLDRWTSPNAPPKPRPQQPQRRRR